MENKIQNLLKTNKIVVETVFEKNNNIEDDKYNITYFIHHMVENEIETILASSQYREDIDGSNLLGNKEGRSSKYNCYKTIEDYDNAGWFYEKKYPARDII